jgi:hypothetical protein
MTALAAAFGQVSVNAGAHETELIVAGIVSVLLGVLNGLPS